MNFLVITVSGTPGTGKTRLAKELSSKFQLSYLSLTNIITKHKLYDSYDKKRKCYVVNEKKMAKYLVKHIKSSYMNQFSSPYVSIQKNTLLKDVKKHIRKLEEQKKVPIKNPMRGKSPLGIIIDSHLSHYLPKNFVDLCIITKTDLSTLKKRLKKRKYNKQKVFENLQAEIFDTCFEEAKSLKHKVVVFQS